MKIERKFDGTMVITVQPGEKQKEIAKAMSIIGMIGAASGLSYTEFRSSIRTQDVADTRHIVIWLILKHTELTRSEIGEILNRHRASITHAENSVEDRMSVSSDYREAIDIMDSQIEKEASHAA